MASDSQYRRIKEKLRELEIELSRAGFKGPLSKLTDIQKEIDSLYTELGPKCVQGAQTRVVKTAFKNTGVIKAQRVTGRIFRPRTMKNG